MQPGDVERTWADTENMRNDFAYKATTSVDVGVNKFLSWYTNRALLDQ